MTKHTATLQTSNSLSDSVFLKLSSIIGNPKKDVNPLIPVSRTTWLEGVKSGKFPRPVKLGGSMNYWRGDDIRKLIADLNAEALA
jgi:predicted DNA-binding transcriptional regulator AlpA